MRNEEGLTPNDFIAGLTPKEVKKHISKELRQVKKWIKSQDLNVIYAKNMHWYNYDDSDEFTKNKFPDGKTFYLTSSTNPRFLFAVTYIHGLGTDRTYVEFDFTYIDPKTNNKWLKVNDLVTRSIGSILQVADFTPVKERDD
jgi:hypothetical protein